MTSASMYVLDLLTEQSITVSEATQLLRTIAARHITVRSADPQRATAAKTTVSPYVPLPWTEEYQSTIVL